MTPPPRLTLAVPFFRGLDYLREALASACAQSRGDWRLVVFDDRGEPEARVRALVESFDDERLAWRGNPATLGMVGNWNRALDEAPTDLVTLLHADDRLLPDYAETMLTFADLQLGATAMACAAELIDEAGRATWTVADAVKALLVPRDEPWHLRGEEGLRALLRGDFIMCPTLLWRRSALGSRRFAPGWQQVQDLELLARLLLDGDAIAGTHHRAYAYRRHPGSATAEQSSTLVRFEEELALYEGLAGDADALGWSRAARTARRRAIVRLHLAFRAAANLAALRPKAALRTLRMLRRGPQQPRPGP